MATFSEGFLNNLGRPAMTQSMFNLGATIGQMPQQYAAKQVREANAAELRGVDRKSPEYFEIQARQAEAAGDMAAAANFAKVANEVRRRQAQASAAQMGTSGELTDMRAAVKEYAALGDIETARNLQKSIKDMESQKGVDALRTYSNAPGIDLTDPKARDGFFRLARAYGVEDPDKMLKEATAPKITVKEQAELIADGFEPGNVERFARTGVAKDLGSKSQEKKEALTEFQKTLVAANVLPGTEEYVRANKARAEMMNTSGEPLDPISQMQTLSNTLQGNPRYKANAKISSDANKTLETIAAIRIRSAKGEPVSELNRVLERSASELFNSDSRAASEIQRFLEGKGVARSFGDWFSTQVAGELTNDTLDSIEAVARQARTSSESQANAEVEKFTGLYADLAHEGIIDTIKENMTLGQSSAVQDFPTDPPEGLTPELWDVMTPQEKAAFTGDK